MKNLIIKNFELTSYNKDEKNKDFCIFFTDPILLHPEITDKKLLEREAYDIRIGSYYSGGESHKGQLKIGIMFRSIKEMMNVYVELRRLNYRPVIDDLDNKNIDECYYNLSLIEKSKSFYPFGARDFLYVWVKEKDLLKFKNDLLSMRSKLRYRCLWGKEDILESKNPHYKI